MVPLNNNPVDSYKNYEKIIRGASLGVIKILLQTHHDQSIMDDIFSEAVKLERLDILDYLYRKGWKITKAMRKYIITSHTNESNPKVYIWLFEKEYIDYSKYLGYIASYRNAGIIDYIRNIHEMNPEKRLDDVTNVLGYQDNYLGITLMTFFDNEFLLKIVYIYSIMLNPSMVEIMRKIRPDIAAKVTSDMLIETIIYLKDFYTNEYFTKDSKVTKNYFPLPKQVTSTIGPSGRLLESASNFFETGTDD